MDLRHAGSGAYGFDAAARTHRFAQMAEGGHRLAEEHHPEAREQQVGIGRQFGVGRVGVAKREVGSTHLTSAPERLAFRAIARIFAGVGHEST